MSATSVNVPPPVASASAQTSAPGTLSTFQDVYHNLPSMQDQSHQDGQPADSKNALLKKKPLAGDSASAGAVTSGTWNNTSLPNAPLTLAVSLGLASLPAPTPSQEPEADLTHTPGPESESTKGPELAATLLTASAAAAFIRGQSPLQNSDPQPGSTQTALEAPHLPSVASSQASEMSSAAAFSPNPVVNAFLPNALPGAIEQSNEAPAKSTPESPEAPAGTVTSGTFPLSAENLAFAMQLAQADAKPTTPATSTAAGTPMPAIQVTPSRGGLSSHSDSPSNDTSGNSDSINLAKPEATARGQLSGDWQSAAAAALLNHAPGAVSQAGPDGAGWLGVGTHVDTRPSMNLSDQPAAAPPVTTLSEPQPLNVAPPRMNLNNEILLNLGNGQSSAAVRLVDRAGTISVSVHASDQDLRNSLRSNLSDLTTQLNAQGVRTEVLKTVSAQSPPESRQEQGSQQQRPSSQQHSFSQNDRQSQRDRRASSQWLEELAEQAGASTLQPGGKNS